MTHVPVLCHREVSHDAPYFLISGRFIKVARVFKMGDYKSMKLTSWIDGCPAFRLSGTSAVQSFAKTHANGSKRFLGRYTALLNDSDLPGVSQADRDDHVTSLSTRRVAIGIWERDHRQEKNVVRYCKYS